MGVDLARFFVFDPGEDPGWGARRRLGEATRALSERCVDAPSDAEALGRAAALVEEALSLLSQGPSPAEAYADGSFHRDPPFWLDRSAMFGACNPVAPPMILRWEEDRSVCDMAFGLRHGGAPGIVHGGLIAAALDQVSGHCATLSGRSGLTVQLDVTYRKAVPVGLPLQVVAWVTETDKRRTFIRGEIRAEEVLYAESSAVFALMDGSRIQAVLGENADPSQRTGR